MTFKQTIIHCDIVIFIKHNLQTQHIGHSKMFVDYLSAVHFQQEIGFFKSQHYAEFKLLLLMYIGLSEYTAH